MSNFEVTLTEEKVREDFEKLKNLHKEFNEMSDVEIEPINQEFYGNLEMVKRIASENNLNQDDAYSYYKLAMWLEMCKEKDLTDETKE